MLAHYVAAESSFKMRCVGNAAGEEPSSIHPTEVAQWDCFTPGGSLDRIDSMTATCGCTTPAPTPGSRGVGLLTPAPTVGGEDGLSTGGIAGIAVAVATVLGGLAFGSYYCCKTQGNSNNQIHCCSFYNNARSHGRSKDASQSSQ